MSEYIKREAVIEKLTGLFKLQASTAKAIVEAIPAADVVEVVRCKDCKEYAEWDDRMICLRFGSWYGNMEPDDYCSLGSKRGEDDV